jgi:hypothetical protein
MAILFSTSLQADYCMFEVSFMGTERADSLASYDFEDQFYFYNSCQGHPVKKTTLTYETGTQDAYTIGKSYEFRFKMMGYNVFDCGVQEGGALFTCHLGR